MLEPIVIYRAKDDSAHYSVEKDRTPNLPMRVIICGKSMLSGKSNYFINMLSRPFDADDKEGQSFYKNDFKPENIYLVCPSADLDSKIANFLDARRVPSSNVMMGFDEDQLLSLYDEIKEKFIEEKAMGRIQHRIIIFDDCSFSGDLKKKANGIINKIFMNGRHLALSVIVTAQKYTDISTGARENCTCLVLFESSRKQADLVYEDHGTVAKADFFRKYYDVVREPHHAMVINYTNPRESRFMDHLYMPIDL